MTFQHLLLFSLCTTLFLTSCNSDDDSLPEEIVQGEFQNGILVSHEGSSISGSVSFISENLTEVQNDIYRSVNGEDLGVFQQSMNFLDSLAFVIVDNFNTVAVVNRYTFKEKVLVTDQLKTPRYIDFLNGKAYITNWGDTALETDDYVAVLNLQTFEVEETIPVGNGPERIVVQDELLYISHKGGFTTNDILSVIDTRTNEVTEITVGDNPDELEFDTSGNLWILCEGINDFQNPGNSTAGSLVKFNTTTGLIDKTFPFTDQQRPSLLVYENSDLFYYLDGAIFKMDEDSDTLPESPILEELNFYGMNIKDNILYGVDAKDFASNGQLDLINLESLEIQQSFEVGVAPSKIYFQ